MKSSHFVCSNLFILIYFFLWVCSCTSNRHLHTIQIVLFTQKREFIMEMFVFQWQNCCSCVTNCVMILYLRWVSDWRIVMVNERNRDFIKPWMSWKITMFFGVFLRTSHICEIGGQRDTSEGKRREEEGNCRIHLHGSILWYLYLIYLVSVV